MKKNKIIAFGFGFFLAGLAFFSGADSVKAGTDTRINEGVYIGSVNVGGMTETEARDAVGSYIDSLMNTTFTLKGAEGSMEASAEDMGVTSDVDSAVEEALTIGNTGNLINRYKEITDLKKNNIVVSMQLQVDKQATAQLIYNKSSELNIESVDNGLKRENGAFIFVPGQNGQEVNIVESVYQINDYLSNQWDGMTTDIDLVVDTVEAKGKQEDFARVKDVLGTFSTNFASSAAGRAQNVKNGCSKINGSVLYPGEEFSVYGAVSPFSQENGYELAGSYANGTTVETFGGGICQVSTTLYNAVIKAELEVSMRFNHSMIVGYVDPSQDAAISGEYKDFRFKNNTEAPIYIEGYCNGGIITFTVYGEETRPSNRVVTFESETLSTTEPKTEFKMSGDFEVGYYSVDQNAHKGIVARLWKVVTVDGVQESRTEFNKSTYKESPKIITVGVKGASEEVKAAIKAAIASGNEDAVKAAVASAKSSEEDDADDSSDDAGKNNDNNGGNDNGGNDNGGNNGGDNNGGGENPEPADPTPVDPTPVDPTPEEPTPEEPVAQ